MKRSPLLEGELRALRQSAFVARLGCTVADVDGDCADVRMPYNPRNSNRSGTVHGGVIASMALIASNLAAAASQRGEAAVSLRPLHLAISFLAAPGEAELRSLARVVHRGRDTAHVSVEIRSTEDRPVAVASVAERFFGGGSTVLTAGEDAIDTRPPVAAGFESLDGRAHTRVGGSPFLKGSEIEVFTDPAEWSLARLPLGPNEGVVGSLHEGAIAALADSCGAYSSYAGSGVAMDVRSATVAMALGFAARSKGPLCGASRLVARTGSHFSNQVEVFEPNHGRIAAFGSVTYRILA